MLCAWPQGRTLPWPAGGPHTASTGNRGVCGGLGVPDHPGPSWFRLGSCTTNAVETELDVSSGAGPGENWSAPRGKWSFPTTCRQAGSGHSAPPLPFVPFLLVPGRPRCLSGAGILGECQLSQALGQALFASLFLALEELAHRPSVPAL